MAISEKTYERMALYYCFKTDRTLIRIAVTFFIASLQVACTQDIQTGDDTKSEWSAPSDADIQALLVERVEHNGVGIVVGVIDVNGPRVVAYGRTAPMTTVLLTAIRSFNLAL